MSSIEIFVTHFIRYKMFDRTDEWTGRRSDRKNRTSLVLTMNVTIHHIQMPFNFNFSWMRLVNRLFLSLSALVYLMQCFNALFGNTNDGMRLSMSKNENWSQTIINSYGFIWLSTCGYLFIEYDIRWTPYTYHQYHYHLVFDFQFWFCFIDGKTDWNIFWSERWKQ